MSNPARIDESHMKRAGSKVTAYVQVYELVTAISGHLHPGQENLLFDLASLTPDPCHILEVGSHKGRSTAAIGLACRGTGRHLHTIDTFRGKTDDTDVQGDEFYLAEFLKNMDTCGLVGTVTPLIGFSSEYWSQWDKPIHMLFLDGGHQYKDVKGDYNAFFPWLVPGGFLVMHDVWGHGGGRDTEQVWHEALPDIEDIHIYHNISWGTKLKEDPQDE